MGAKLYKYRLRFKGLTKKLYEEQNRLYNICVLSIRLEELQNKGGYMRKIYSPTTKGTLIDFTVVENEEEYKKQFEHIAEAAIALNMAIEIRDESEEKK